MPYIINERREAIDNGQRPETSGELNYAITKLLLRYWINSPENYEAINAIMGAVEGAKTEFYRRVAVPYENNKIKVNGDVYPC